MKTKHIVVILTVLTIIVGGGYAVYKNLSSKTVAPIVPVTETRSASIPDIGDVLDVYHSSSYPNGIGKESQRLDPNILTQKEVIEELLEDLSNAKELPDEQPKVYPIRRNWSLNIECKNGSIVIIHGNYSTKSTQQQDSNGNITATGMEYSPVPNEYLIKYIGNEEDTKIYSPELTEFIRRSFST